jgi:PhnB protein
MTMIAERTFDAPLQLVWQAWTDSAILEQWWAPMPWKAVTKTMDFKPGGKWHYFMVGPQGEKHWSMVEYKEIVAPKYFTQQNSFCDEQGNRIADMPGSSHWHTAFTPQGETTTVTTTITYDSAETMERMINMGFKGGFAMAHENLDAYIQAQGKLRSQLKTGTAARVSTYLNFPGNTEEAMNFYKSVFKTEFSGMGIQRFGDIPQGDGYPPVAENVKKMILHVELPIVAGHVLMATDAPKEMGFTVTPGNNMHISLEPETREEAKRLFDGLSQDGKIIMPLADMFWGAYFGQLTDKFGINWMVNCTEKK